MNNANQISQQTQLFGYIGEHAGSSRFSALLNKLFKENQDDFMMLPMNIRRDDFFFTLSNMKKSHVNGAILSNEYVTQSLDILDEASALARRSGMCDILFREGEKLRGDITASAFFWSNSKISKRLKSRLSEQIHMPKL